MVKKFIKQVPLPNKYLHYVPVPLSRLKVLKTPTLALAGLISREGLGVYASSDVLFKGAIFGRDSIEVAEDILTIRPKLVRRIILTLASLQGVENNPKNEENPGKIVHEYRRQVVDGRAISGKQKEIFDKLSGEWGGNERELIYYGSVDATPNFLRLLDAYRYEYGDDIFLSEVVLKNGKNASILQIAENSLEWIISQLSESKSGLMEFQRKNPLSFMNHVWKDSNEFYVHNNGEIANHDSPISSIELQALVYDALLAGAHLFPKESQKLAELAGKLRQRTFELLWQPGQSYFALGTDFDSKGKLRLINISTANPAEMLDTCFFEDLPIKLKAEFIGGIIKEIFGTEFLTDAGIRSRGLSEARLIPFWDYHGSFTTWPKETYDIAKGLRRQGFALLAAELENRLVNVIKAIGYYPEFIYVDARGRVLGSSATSRSHGQMIVLDSHDRPEKTQAWTVSAYLAITAFNLKRFRSQKHPQAVWQADLENEVLSSIPHVKRFKSAKELMARYPSYPYELGRTK